MPRWGTATPAGSSVDVGFSALGGAGGVGVDHRHRVAAFVGDVGEGAILAEVNVNGRRGSPVLVVGGRNC